MTSDSDRLCFGAAKVSDRQSWAISVNTGQTAHIGTVWSGSTLFTIPSASFGLINHNNQGCFLFHLEKILIGRLLADYAETGEHNNWLDGEDYIDPGT